MKWAIIGDLSCWFVKNGPGFPPFESWFHHSKLTKVNIAGAGALSNILQGYLRLKSGEG
jgi:hypothetical protein